MDGCGKFEETDRNEKKKKKKENKFWIFKISDSNSTHV